MAVPEYEAVIAGKAEVAAAQARALAHRIMPAGRGQNIRVEREGTKILVANHDHGGHLDEWGSINNPPYAPLRRGVRSAGLRFREE
jgi:hypothetical protein